MAGYKRSKVLPVASSLEATAKESGHGSKGACKKADGGAVDEEGGGEAKVEGGEVRLRREGDWGEGRCRAEEGRLGLKGKT